MAKNRIYQPRHNLSWCSIDLPAYAVCGQVNGTMFFCTDFHLNTDHFYNIVVRTPDSTIFDYNATTQEYPEIRKKLSQFMHSEKFERRTPYFEQEPKPEKPLYGAPSNNVSTREYAPFRTHARCENLDYEYRAVQYSDIGYKGYANEYETKAYVADRCETLDSKCHVSYKYETPIERRAIVMNNFDGYDRNHDSWHRDGMKIAQHKLRPESTTKRYNVASAKSHDPSYADSVKSMTNDRLQYELNNTHGTKRQIVTKEIISRW